MTTENQANQRASILARIVPAFSGWIVMLGAAISALLIMGVMNAMRNAESAGIGAVASGMAEANLSTVISLYFAIFLVGVSLVLMIVRAVTTTTTASPSAWFLVIVAVLSVVPLGLVWKANSLLMQTLMGRGNVSFVAPTIQLCLNLTLITAGLFSLILLSGSVVPLPSVLRAKRSWAPIVVLVLIEVVLIGLAVVFQMHMSWLQRVGMRESF